MIIRYFFLDDTDTYVLCNSSNINKLTSLLKSASDGTQSPWVGMKLQFLDIPEGENLTSVRLFLAPTSSLGTREHLIEGTLEENWNKILSFPDNTGLYFKLYEGSPEIKFNHNVGKDWLSGIPLLNESNPTDHISNNDEKTFMIKFVPSNDQSNQRFFLSLEAEGVLTNE